MSKSNIETIINIDSETNSNFLTRFIDEFGQSLSRTKSANNKDSLLLLNKSSSEKNNSCFLPVFCSQVKKFIFNSELPLTNAKNKQRDSSVYDSLLTSNRTKKCDYQRVARIDSVKKQRFKL